MMLPEAADTAPPSTAEPIPAVHRSARGASLARQQPPLGSSAGVAESQGSFTQCPARRPASGGASPWLGSSWDSCFKIWRLVLDSPPISAPFGFPCRACRWAWRQQPQHRLRCNVLRSSQSYLLRLIIIFIVISNQTLLAGTAAGQSDSDRGCRGAAGDSSPL